MYLLVRHVVVLFFNVWLQSALQSFAIVCDYMETALFAIVCDLRSAIVCDHMETSHLREL